jgi:multiple sugar transport system permease protein
MVGTYGEVQWGEIMAATTVSAIPMFIFFLFFQKWMVRGLTAGAVK